VAAVAAPAASLSTTMQKDRLQSIRNTERAAMFLSHGLVAVMLVCAVVPFIDLGERLYPGWDGRYLLPFCLLIAIEALMSWRAAGKFMFPTWEWFLYRGTEFVVMFAGLKAYIYNHRGWDQLWIDLPLWRENFGAFFDGEYFSAYIMVLMTWMIATRFAATLSELEGDEQLLRLERESVAQSDRAGTRRRLITDIFLVGAVMLFFTAIVRSDLALLGLAAAPLRLGLLNVVLYFVLGLVLLALSQFAVLRARWNLDRIPIAHNIAPRWAIYSAVTLVACALVAVLLPTHYSLGLLDTLAIVIAAIQFVLYLILLLLLLPFQFLLSLLLGGAARLPPMPSPPPNFQTTPPGDPAAPVPWIEILRSIVFWAVFIGIVGFSLYYYLRQRSDLVAALSRLPGWKWLKSALWWMRGGVRRVNEGIASAIRRVTGRRGTALAAAWDYISLRGLSPRDRVRFYYLALVRRAAEAGLPRRPAQTPLDYQNSLAPRLGEAAGELEALTGTYMEARYSEHPVSIQKANLAREWWDRLKRVLRPPRKG
jgi:hypothetical protein